MESLTKARAGTRRKVHQDTTPKEVKPLSNEPDAETVLIFLGKIMKEEVAVAAAKKRLNKIWKLAINSGIVRKDLELVRRFADQDADTVLKTLARIQKYAKDLDVPIGSQMSLFEIPNSSILTAKEQGERAYRAGHYLGITGAWEDKEAYPPGTEFYDRHMEGWHAGQKILSDRIGPIDIAMNSEQVEKKKAKADDPAPPDEQEQEDADEEA